jgi:hypothetical protein
MDKVMGKVTIDDMIKKAEEMLFFEVENKEGIMYLLKGDLKRYLKTFSFRGFQELQKDVERRREIAKAENNIKMMKVYSIMGYLINNLENFYLSFLFENYFEIK